MHKASARKGFTLIEILVVVAIIAILTGMSLGVYSSVQRRGKVSATKAMIERLKAAIENYANDFGDYPPSTGKRAGLTSNGVNDGIESLVRCLLTTKKNGPYFEFPDESLGNADGDSTKKDGPRSALAVATLYEVNDAFGRPLIYLHNRDYKTGHNISQIDDDGKAKNVPAKGASSEKTGQYQSLTGFQLWSTGPDGKNDGGKADDVVSWE